MLPYLPFYLWSSKEGDSWLLVLLCTSRGQTQTLTRCVIWALTTAPVVDVLTSILQAGKQNLRDIKEISSGEPYSPEKWQLQGLNPGQAKPVLIPPFLSHLSYSLKKKKKFWHLSGNFRNRHEKIWIVKNSQITANSYFSIPARSLIRKARLLHCQIGLFEIPHLPRPPLCWRWALPKGGCHDTPSSVFVCDQDLLSYMCSCLKRTFQTSSFYILNRKSIIPPRSNLIFFFLVMKVQDECFDSSNRLTSLISFPRAYLHYDRHKCAGRMLNGFAPF